MLSWNTASVPGLAGNETGFTFTWWLDGEQIENATGTSMTLSNAGKDDVGIYEVVAMDGTDTYVSMPLHLTVGGAEGTPAVGAAGSVVTVGTAAVLGARNRM